MAKGERAKFDADDLLFALDNAAEFLDMEEWPESDGGAQEAANKEAANLIRKMAKRRQAKEATDGR